MTAEEILSKHTKTTFGGEGPEFYNSILAAMQEYAAIREQEIAEKAAKEKMALTETRLVLYRLLKSLRFIELDERQAKCYLQADEIIKKHGSILDALR